MKIIIRCLALAALSALGACVAPSNATIDRSAPPLPPRAMTPPPTQPAPSRDGFMAPRLMQLPGLESVIGQNTLGLLQQFGQPALDVREGDARKLQYRSQACVLDIYLYPLRQGAEPSATYVDARRASDGQDVDRAACVAATRR